ncbi:MAG TPA: PIN domain-containing protein [Verrucomicrobiae bacterium]
MDNVVLDTSAWFALAESEPGADEVEAQVAAAWLGRVSLHASFVSLAELQYIRTNEQGTDSAEKLIAWVKQQPVHWLHSDDALCGEAAKFKAAHKVSFADAFVAATAQRLNATLVHKDPEFDALNGVIKLHPLPRKTA